VNLQWVKGAPTRRWWLAFLIALCASGGAIAGSIAAGSGASSKGTITTASPATFRTDLIARLRMKQLNYHWVVCVRTAHQFKGVRVVRCNVDFGEPHIQAYCSVLRGARLLTSEQDPAIPCSHDNAGFSAPVRTYG
jgi:hypothetical protein